MRDFTFHNVTITIEASTAEEAYRNLCEMFARTDVEYQTDTYSVDASDEDRPTSELFPCQHDGGTRGGICDQCGREV